MLKKIISGAIALFLGLLAVGFVGAPANASETKKEAVCQATADGHFNPQLVARDSIINGRGDNGINENDIVAPFDYNFDGGAVEHYPGSKAWADPANQTLWANLCKPTNNVLTPVLPVSPVATCTNPNPVFTLPVQKDGINVTSAADDKGNFTVSYELPKNTTYNTYAFPAGFVNPVTVKTTDNRPLDIYWDSAKGACNLPDTGIGSINSVHILYAGGLIGAGLIVTALNRRKTS